MSYLPSISFTKFAAQKKGTAVLLAGKDGALPAASDIHGDLSRAIKAAAYKGKIASSLEILAPAGSALDRVVLLGTASDEPHDESTWLRLGGVAQAALSRSSDVTIVLRAEAGDPGAADAATFAMGMLLRAYRFDKYKSKKDDEAPKSQRIAIQCADPAGAKKAFAEVESVASGVHLARDLVNEPANALGPVEFAARAAELEALGVKVEILSEKEMKKLGMGALLGVAQGSPRGARLVVMQWNGGKAKEQPVAFIGKGVTFDTGGNSMKPAAGMEDMKGDMGGAAAVVGLMHALASRKARSNVVGIVGLVENSVDGNAQRPGDIVTSMSGQTIEVLNTDAEGRLVLCDALWYCNDRFKPRFMVNLATLTGAIIIALGQHHAGLFSNDDELSARIEASGKSTGEWVWRMPLGPEYDKLIDSKNADMKNIGGRYGGAITAAQFLKRFVKDTPWAHLDIAGTAMGSPASDTNHSWGSGYGVRLLDRLVRDHYEA